MVASGWIIEAICCASLKIFTFKFFYYVKEVRFCDFVLKRKFANLLMTWFSCLKLPNNWFELENMTVFIEIFFRFFVCLFVCLLLEYFLICYLHFIIVSKFGSVNLFKIFQGEVNIKQILGKVANRKSQHFNPRKMYPTKVYSFSSITQLR